jgi:hypothetical protein
MVIFSCERFLRFCRGFWRKRVVEGGFLVVNLWWNRGDLWCVDGHFSESKIFHLLMIYFLGIPVLGMGGVLGEVFPP